MRLLALPLALALLAAPALAGELHREATMDPAYGLLAMGSVHVWRLPLEQGQEVAVRLAWASPQADLDVFLIAPAAGCDLLAPDCLLGAEGPVHGATCPGEANSGGSTRVGLGPAEEAFAWATPTAGEHQLWVYAALALPGAVPYALGLASPGALLLEGPDVSTGFVGSPHCRFVS
jgi:hypothetical protein